MVNDPTLQADVASFAASLGLIAGDGASAGTGFDDSDFHKTGPIALKQQTKTKSRKQPSGKPAAPDAKVPGPSMVNGAKPPSSKSKSWATIPQVNQATGGNNHGKRKSPFVEADSWRKRSKSGGDGEVDSHKAPSVHSFRVRQFSSSLWFDAAAAAAERVVWNDGSSEGGGADSRNHVQWEMLVQNKMRQGQELLDSAASEYAKYLVKDSDRRWLSRAGKYGTSGDKVAAMTVLLQDNPIANLRTLDSLLGMVTSRGGKRLAVTGMSALKELFIGNLLPNRKLKYLSQQLLSALPARKEGKDLLLFWYWEDCLKRRYEQFVIAIEEATKDTLTILKEKAVKTVYELLKTKPEQERRLLAALINKLGDPERKIASNASYLLSCLLSEHPNMKAVVVEEVESFVLRPHVGLRARYYAAVFLNQIVLSSRGEGPKLAKRLIDLYFVLFGMLTTEDKKAFAASKERRKSKGKDGRRQKNFKTQIQGVPSVEEHTEIDSRLLSALLTGINRAFPFVAAEEVDVILQAHTPVLFRLVHAKNLNVGIQALILLHQLLSKNLAISDRYYRALYAVLCTAGLFKSSKVEMFIGLLFKAIKVDINSKRVAAFLKRLMQVAAQESSQYACGSLLMISEVLKARPSLWNAIIQPEGDDEEEEHFVDILEDSGPVADLSDIEHLAAFDKPQGNCAQEGSSADQETTSGVSRREINAGMARMQKHAAYMPGLREPSYCNADQACWWELAALAAHVHPSVAAMARTLLSGSHVVYAGNPLRDFSLGIFLDRFVEKKPKVRKSKEGTWHGSTLSFPTRMVESASSLPIGGQFVSMPQADVAPEDIVFHKFYLAKSSSKCRSHKNLKNVADDEITGAGAGDDQDYGLDDTDDEEVEALLELDEGADVMSSDYEDDDDSGKED